jgi:hypothetical protein
MQRVEGGSGWHARRAEDASPTLHIVYERLVAERSGRPLCIGHGRIEYRENGRQ